ncbi:MAG: biotin carboxylase N-terminal domain-containing protein [Xanthobacteraceae bacterium]
MAAEKVLIVNRGEIACRIIRSCRKLGMGTIAIFSDADADSMHVGLADESHHVGPAPARDRYLKGGLIVDIARETGARYVHPGYGFLAENADFARNKSGSQARHRRGCSRRSGLAFPLCRIVYPRTMPPAPRHKLACRARNPIGSKARREGWHQRFGRPQREAPFHTPAQLRRADPTQIEN